MNDFTKEELEGILEGLQIIDADPGIRPQIYWEDSLKEKLQSMIDNYCDHEFNMDDWTNDSSGCRWYKCHKCEARYR